MIAVVDDDSSVREAVESLLASHNFSVKTFVSAEQFLAFADLDMVCCVLTDIQMPGMSGIELQHHLKAIRCSAPVILMTAFFNDSARRIAIADGAAAYVAKPFSSSALIAEIQRVLTRR